MSIPFTTTVRSPELRKDLVLVSGSHFMLGDVDLDRFFQISLPRRERDLLRIMMAVYVADRLVRRDRRDQDSGSSRVIELRVDVADADFWNDRRSTDLLQDAVRRLSSDSWNFSFVPHFPVIDQPPLFSEAPAVCLYSGGLDSAAGCCHRLRSDRTPVIAVTAAHQSSHGMIKGQIRALSDRYGVQVRPVLCRTRLVHPPRLDRQETSQRMRSLLFTALGGAIASAVRASDVDVFENGVGAINLPPQLGMMLGSMATRGCHPGFLAAMGELLSHVAGRPLRFHLPMLRNTKAEAVRALVEDRLHAVATSTMSCVHWPLRNASRAKQCGRCFGCLGRRQAMLVADAAESNEAYEVDLFGTHSDSLYLDSKLAPLKACLMQVVALRHLNGQQPLPFALRQHFTDAGVSEFQMQIEEVVNLYQRYAHEWELLIERAKGQNLKWASWVKQSGLAA